MLARNGIIAHIYIISLFPGGSVNCLHLLLTEFWLLTGRSFDKGQAR